MSPAEAARKRTEDRTVERIETKHDPIGYLSHQHRDVETLFHDIDALTAKEVSAREQLFVRLADLLGMHMSLEDEVFYPAARAADEELILKCQEEHDLVKNLIAKIQKSGPQDATFRAKVNVLREIVHHHVMQEEQELFPKAMETIGEEDMRKLFDEMRAMEEKITREEAKTEGP